MQERFRPPTRGARRRRRRGRGPIHVSERQRSGKRAQHRSREARLRYERTWLRRPKPPIAEASVEACVGADELGQNGDEEHRGFRVEDIRQEPPCDIRRHRAFRSELCFRLFFRPPNIVSEPKHVEHASPFQRRKKGRRFVDSETNVAIPKAASKLTSSPIAIPATVTKPARRPSANVSAMFGPGVSSTIKAIQRNAVGMPKSKSPERRPAWLIVLPPRGASAGCRRR